MSLDKEINMKSKINTVNHEALLNIVRIASLIDKRAYEFFLEFNITQAQYNVLVVLKLEGGPLNQVDISRRLVVSRAGITSILDKLEKKGYIRREKVKSDRRVLEVSLTDESIKLLEVVEPRYLEEVEKNMKVLNEKECKNLNESLFKLSKKFKK